MWKKSYGDEGGTSKGEQVPFGWSVGHKSNGQDWKGKLALDHEVLKQQEIKFENDQVLGEL